MTDFSFVSDRIATGGTINSTSDVGALLAAGLNCIIDARDNFDGGLLLVGDPGISYLYNPTHDDGAAKPVNYWRRTLTFALPLLAQPGNKIYCNCALGVNRGPSNAYCILVAQGIDPVTAENMIREARPQVELAYKSDALAACLALGYIEEKPAEKDDRGCQLVQVQFDNKNGKPYTYAWGGDGALDIGDRVFIPAESGGWRGGTGTICALGSNYPATVTLTKRITVSSRRDRDQRCKTVTPPRFPDADWWNA